MPLVDYGAMITGQGGGSYTGQAQSVPAAQTLAGAPARGYSPQYGGVPQVPNPAATQAQATGGNITNLPQLEALAGGLNPFITSQSQLPLQQGIPGYSGLTAQSSRNIGSLLQGRVPADVLAQIEQTAAQRGISTGSPGGPNANAAMLAALGQTSLGLQSQGESELSGAVARTPQPQLFNPASFLVTPEQQQQAAAAANLYASAPVPSQAVAAGMQPMPRIGGGGVGGTSGATWSPALPDPFANPQVGLSTATGTTSSNPSPADYTAWQQWIQQLPGATSGTDQSADNQLANMDVWSGVTPPSGQFPDYGGMAAPPQDFMADTGP
jgi:hypothetical protein